MTEMVETTMGGVTYEEPETDLWDRIAMEAISSRYSPESTLELARGLETAVRRIRDHEAAIAEMTEPQRKQLELAHLREQLAAMTAREKQWREGYMSISSERSQASVRSFSEFCDGHKAGMRKAREIR